VDALLERRLSLYFLPPPRLPDPLRCLKSSSSLNSPSSSLPCFTQQQQRHFAEQHHGDTSLRAKQTAAASITTTPRHTRETGKILDCSHFVRALRNLSQPEAPTTLVEHLLLIFAGIHEHSSFLLLPSSTSSSFYDFVVKLQGLSRPTMVLTSASNRPRSCYNLVLMGSLV